MTEQTVILAAGLGSRLMNAEAGIPKPLMEVARQPLIAHALAHAEASGCREAVIVIGYQGARVQAAVETIRTSLRLRFVASPDPQAPNGHSLLAAAACARPAFFLQMVDHVFAQPVLPLLEPHGPDDGRGRLLVDRSPDPAIDLADATKVRTEGRRISAIGKGLERWDAIDTGCFRLTSAVFEALLAVPADEPKTVSSAMRRLAAHGRLMAVELGGVAWADVDTPSDRVAAEQVLMHAAVMRAASVSP